MTTSTLERSKIPNSTPLDTPSIDRNVKQRVPGAKFYANHRSVLINSLAITYILSGYCIAIWCITRDMWQVNLLGSVLLVHTLLWAAYFVHEFFHDNIFASRTLNTMFGEVFLFLTGSCYSSFNELAHHHIIHHTQRVDLSPFAPYSMPDVLKSLPKFLVNFIIFLELLYLPAVNLGLRWLIALSPFLGKTRKRDRLRNGLLLLVRGGLFTALTLYSPHGVIIYFVSYVFFLNMTQFLECFQHTFPTYRVTDKVPKYSFEHVELNTYTIIISRRFRWLDLLFFLNHNYHSAHHRIMTCPWYLLAELDQKNLSS